MPVDVIPAGVKHAAVGLDARFPLGGLVERDARDARAESVEILEFAAVKHKVRKVPPAVLAPDVRLLPGIRENEAAVRKITGVVILNNRSLAIICRCQRVSHASGYLPEPPAVGANLVSQETTAVQVPLGVVAEREKIGPALRAWQSQTESRGRSPD